MYFWVFILTCFVHLNSSGSFVSPSIVENLNLSKLSLNDSLYQLVNNNKFVTEAKSSLNNSLNLLLNTKNSVITALDLFKKQKSFEELAKEANLLAEKFEVTTEDGYILGVFHIVSTNAILGLSPVLLVHGIGDSSDTFILRKDTSLVRELVDAGYDVWFLNCRGNKYSRKHTNLNPDGDKEFWNFSFHEMGIYDLPATIDFVLDKAEEEALYVIGHSQGNQIIWVMGSEKEEYNKKVKVGIALAPICFVNNLYKSLAIITVPLYPLLKIINDVLGPQELLYDKGFIRKAEQIICNIPALGYPICLDGIFNPVFGFDSDQIEPEFFTAIIPQYPTSTSFKNGLHLIQMQKSANFSLYDYGAKKNQELYGSKEPRNYELNKVDMKVVLLQAANDFLSPIENTARLASKLPNVIQFTILDREQANHIDFVWGRDAKTYVYNHVLEVLGNNP